MGERAKRAGLAAAIAVLTVNVFTGAPLAALWVGSRVQSRAEASMLGIFVVALTLVLLCLAIMRVLGALGARYDRATGGGSNVHQHVPWLRSMRGERPHYPGSPAPALSAPERIVVVIAVIAVVAFEVWFFFFSSSPIDQRSGRGALSPDQVAARLR